MTPPDGWESSDDEEPEQLPPIGPKNRHHVSPSELREFLGCPLRFWYRYRMGFWTDRTKSFFALGNAVHFGLERWYMGEKLYGVRDNAGALADYERAWIDEQSKVDWSTEEAKDPFLLGAAGRGLLQANFDAGDDWRAQEVEKTLFCDIEHSRFGKLPYPLKVRLDMLVQGDDVVEHKTSDKRWPAGKENQETQVTAEVMVVRANYGHDPTVTHNILVNNVKPIVDRRTSKRTQDDIDRLYVQVRALLDAEERGVIYPNPTAFAHANCEFRGLCDGWTEHPQRIPPGRALQMVVPGLSDYAARVPGAVYEGPRR